MPRTFAETLSFVLRYQAESAEDVAARLRQLGLLGATAEWLEGVAAGAVFASDLEQRALAQVLRVPLEYFADPRTTALVDAVLVLTAALQQRNMQLVGPCRCGSVSAQDYLALYAALLLGSSVNS
ncbi:hypothetical protein [Saccharopolyspora phatthalungensis]|uniref:Sugar (Pentulose or hexulose) kinase n=1 Tax=Saccharopolyspora phatthalungensis TaxID=664693 RepID=A0A840QCH1_9PSEU|nr:hypothetical protein [Saccharopolyspora phatthalungensis]MBB5157480.1 sugar (pentulose or hexulose) kinase [Saccharopolyspora phatthalungensis]